MNQNYLKFAVRNLWKHKSHTFINIFGLATGLGACLLLLLFVRSEWRYDRFHTKADRIYRAWIKEDYGENQVFVNTVTPIPLGPALQQNFPEVEAMCRVFKYDATVRHGNNTFSESVVAADPSFFQLFDFGLRTGDGNAALTDHNAVVISEKAALKYFGQTDPIGQTLDIRVGPADVPFTVKAVSRDVPEESSIQFDFLIPFSHETTIFREGARKSWTNVFLETYVLVREPGQGAAVVAKMPAMLQQQFGERYKEGQYKVYLQPLTAVHLDNTLPAGNEPVGNPAYVKILAAVGLLILLIACINFVTLSVARSASRAAEVGIRKAVGARRKELIRQFWGEAALMTVISFGLGMVLAQLLLPLFNRLVEKKLVMAPDPGLAALCLGLIAVTALAAGFYPALVLSGFRPIEALKGRAGLKGNDGWLRRSLIVGQFTISVALIGCTLGFREQLKYVHEKDLGYRKDRIVVVPTNQRLDKGNELGQRYVAALQQQKDVRQAGVSVFSFRETPWANIGYEDEKGVYRNFQFNVVDPKMLEAMDIRVAAGKAPDEQNTDEKANGIWVNEALVREYGWPDPLGQKLPWKYEGRVVGVLKDFHWESLHTPIGPLVLSLQRDSVMKYANDVGFAYSPAPRVSVSLQPGDLQDQAAMLKSVWQSVAPGQEFEFHFLDETLSQQYARESRVSTLITLASVLSVVITCLGLFGLAMLTVARRTREIGIRKVMGASVAGITRLLAGDFLKLVLVAVVLASPLAWWALNKWLADFAYRIDVQWWMFLVAGAVAATVAFLTVSFQSIKAALANPVKSLRSE